SMYRGFPVGYLLFWANAQNQGTKQIGSDQKQHQTPALLIVDGQQRLTSLYAVFRGKSVRDDECQEMKVEIAFRPRDGRFEVSDPAIARDPEFIANISHLFASGKSSWGAVTEFLARLESKKKVDPRDKEIMGQNLERLFDLGKYPFTALEISPEVDEEAVSDIFVRINSEGVKLNQGDFILTLRSVFWEDGRQVLESFAEASRKPPTKGSGPSPKLPETHDLDGQIRSLKKVMNVSKPIAVFQTGLLSCKGNFPEVADAIEDVLRRRLCVGAG